MATTDVTTTPTLAPSTGRRIGYAAAIVVNLLILGFINVWPGWDSLAFVTADAAGLVSLINLSITVTILLNVVYLAYDGFRFRALGEAITSTITLLVSLVVLAVFPFDFSAYAFPWAVVTRLILLVAVLGSGISIIVNVVKLIRGPGR